MKMIMISELLRSEQPVNQGGFSTRNEYMLKPKVFKKFGNFDEMLNIILNTNYLSIN
jgi:hypothetical protein